MKNELLSDIEEDQMIPTIEYFFQHLIFQNNY
jgi:hypothetical protein